MRKIKKIIKGNEEYTFGGGVSRVHLYPKLDPYPQLLILKVTEEFGVFLFAIDLSETELRNVTINKNTLRLEMEGHDNSVFTTVSGFVKAEKPGDFNQSGLVTEVWSSGDNEILFSLDDNAVKAFNNTQAPNKYLQAFGFWFKDVNSAFKMLFIDMEV